MNPIAIILIIVAVFMIAFIILRRVELPSQKQTHNDIDNLKKHFGDDYGKILGGSSTPSALPVDGSSPVVTAPSGLGTGSVSTVIKQKMAGAAFLGVNINVIDPLDMPKIANVDFCNLVSLITAKGLGACAKNNSKSFSIEVKSNGDETFIRCIYPAVSIPASEENIKNAVEKLGGKISSETENSITTDMVLIPTNNIS